MFSPIPEVLDDIRRGKFVILVDDEDRENEGDLILAAEHITAEKLTFMTRFAGGYLCLVLTEDDCDRLDLHPQAPRNTSVRGTAFTVSIDAHPRHGVSTGISAADRVKCIKLAIDPASTPADFVRPGHINPLRARRGGVLVRLGQTEGSVDLARLAGCTPAAMLIEVVRPDGQMARRPDLDAIAKEHGFKMCSVEQLIRYRLQHEPIVHRMDPVNGTPIHTEFGDFTLIAFESAVDPQPHLVLTVGGVGRLDASGRAVRREEPTLVRMHRRDVLGDIFLDKGSSRDGAPSAHSLHAAMRAIQAEGAGAIVYLRPAGQTDDPRTRLTAFHHRETRDDAPDLRSHNGLGAEAVPMEWREFGVGGQILRELGLTRLRLLTNQKKDLPGLDAFGLQIQDHVGL
jgi:3,4-dihydroxy 2-butanone 4-phosphate synthase/GTP cyclohydrolase II